MASTELPVINSSSPEESKVDNEPAEEPKKGLSFLDKYLSAWILLAAGIGLALGQSAGVIKAIKASSVGTTNIPIAIGLIFMIYPPLAKVQWNEIGKVFKDRGLLFLMLVLNWIVGPWLMFFLSIAFFNAPDKSDFMSGLSLVGCARCIAMVLVWNELAFGDREYCAAIVAVNSIVTIALYSPYAILYLVTLPKMILGGDAGVATVNVSVGDIAESVGIYLGVPLAAGLLSWLILTRVKGQEWYYGTFAPPIGKLTLAALLFTVVVLFASQSKSITHQIGSVLYAAVPLIIYFLTMFVGTFYASWYMGATYAQAVTLSFTAASNNFELALAVAVGTFGLNSGEALMSVVGALIEIPTMLSLVKIAFYFRDHLYHEKGSAKGAALSSSSALDKKMAATEAKDATAMVAERA